jgi:hypothetical protein
MDPESVALRGKIGRNIYYDRNWPEVRQESPALGLGIHRRNGDSAGNYQLLTL